MPALFFSQHLHQSGVFKHNALTQNLTILAIKALRFTYSENANTQAF